MPAIDKAAGRLAVLIVLLVLLGASLRGYLPAAGRASSTRAPASPVATVSMIVLLGVSLGIIAVAFITRVRHRRPVAGSIGALRAGAVGGKRWSSWRVLMIGLAVIFAWLLIVWLLTRLLGQHDFGLVMRTPEPGSDLPATGTAVAPTGTEAGPQGSQGSQPDSGRYLFGLLAATVLGMLLALAGTVGGGRTRRNDRASVPVDQPVPHRDVGSPEALARATELGLAVVDDACRGPREAIIGCYATMERELARVPDAAPQDFDTPTEVLNRAVEHHALSAANAAQLVELFVEARFSPHLMTEVHRQNAIRILRLVLTELSRA